MTDIKYVEVARWAVERVRDYVDATTDDAMFLSAVEVDNIIAALDEALA